MPSIHLSNHRQRRESPPNGGRPVVAAGGSPRSASPQEKKPARYSRFDEPINQRPGGRPNAAPTVPRTIRYQQMDTHSPPIPRDPNIGWIIRDTQRFGANRDNSKPANNSGTPIFHPRELRILDVPIPFRFRLVSSAMRRTRISFSFAYHGLPPVATVFRPPSNPPTAACLADTLDFASGLHCSTWTITSLSGQTHPIEDTQPIAIWDTQRFGVSCASQILGVPF